MTTDISNFEIKIEQVSDEIDNFWWLVLDYSVTGATTQFHSLYHQVYIGLEILPHDFSTSMCTDTSNLVKFQEPAPADIIEANVIFASKTQNDFNFYPIHHNYPIQCPIRDLEVYLKNNDGISYEKIFDSFD